MDGGGDADCERSGDASRMRPRFTGGVPTPAGLCPPASRYFRNPDPTSVDAPTAQSVNISGTPAIPPTQSHERIAARRQHKYHEPCRNHFGGLLSDASYSSIDDYQSTATGAGSHSSVPAGGDCKAPQQSPGASVIHLVGSRPGRSREATDNVRNSDVHLP
jgi:hypothetical protein